MFGITASTLIARQGKLATARIDDDRLLLGRMPNKYLNIVVPEARVTIDRKCVLRQRRVFTQPQRQKE